MHLTENNLQAALAAYPSRFAQVINVILWVQSLISHTPPLANKPNNHTRQHSPPKTYKYKGSVKMVPSGVLYLQYVLLLEL